MHKQHDLTPTAFLDRLSRTVAHKRTQERIAPNFRPISGSQVSCDNSDLCSYLTDILGYVYPGEFDIKYYAAAIFNFFSVSEGSGSWIYSGLQNINDDSNAIRSNVGQLVDYTGTPRDGGETLFNELEATFDSVEAVGTDTEAINTTVNAINAALPYPNGQATDVHADINRAIASIILANTLLASIQEAVTDATGPLGTLLQVIGLLFPTHSGGTEVVNYNTSLVDNGAPPPYTSLTEGTTQSLGTGADVDIPAGTYAYRFNFTVPSYWARRGYFAQDMTPSIAVLDWCRDSYSFDNPKYIRQENWLAFPLHPAANRFTVDLAPGVTGSYTPLVL